MKRTAAIFSNTGDGMVDYVYARGRRDRLAELTNLYPHLVSSESFAAHVDGLHDLEVIFSTWGMPALTSDQVRQLPALKALFYAAGSVKNFARPFLENGVTVCSAWQVNGEMVATFVLGQILLAAKGYWQNTADCARRGSDPDVAPWRAPGIAGCPVALLGFGTIGRDVAKLLRGFPVDVMVVDPYADAEDLAAVGARRVELDEAFATAQVVSNHLPNLPDLQGVFTGKHFSLLPPGATFINTGRGAQVREDDMVAVLQERPDIVALLDVTLPEPPPPGSPLYDLPNVHLTSHIAGAMNDEVVLMADAMIAEFEAWNNGGQLRYNVNLEMLELLA